MNGYELMARSYKLLLEQGKIEKDIAEKNIRIYEFLQNCDKEDINILMDSSAFNDIVKGYINIVADTSGLDEEAAAKVRNKCRHIFDGCNAKEALEYYYKH